MDRKAIAKEFENAEKQSRENCPTDFV
ncbi:hypothetical protein RED65_11859 [Oceanobacter sp. RED65]|uniref:Uncharacterized protein n=1 Tax=Bermanella marisrubri TaxID=207949 RepID=Q1N0C2_9GAMM|nr:hypothetical protein RED65_06327 [Oceanobacter sp. RED65] [Bermanella marisrubri]EAT12763.1 hypothetical protein RED65_11859 [Oceanobacter sp. RED65] [Bermanella marisrubri]